MKKNDFWGLLSYNCHLSNRSNYGVRFSLLYDITLLLLTISRTQESNKMACVFVV